jgi:hypothetical protein
MARAFRDVHGMTPREWRASQPKTQAGSGCRTVEQMRAVRIEIMTVPPIRKRRTGGDN